MKPGFMTYPILLNFFLTARLRDLIRDPEAVCLLVSGKTLQPSLKTKITNHGLYHPDFAVKNT